MNTKLEIRRVARLVRRTALSGLVLLPAAAACSARPEALDDAHAPNMPRVTSAMPAAASVAFDRIVYQPGDSVRLSLELGDVAPAVDTLEVAVAGASSGDAEVVTLVRDASGRFVSRQGLPLSSDRVTPEDDRLSLADGEQFYALFAVDPAEQSLASLAGVLLSDFAVLEASTARRGRVDPDAALTDEERTPVEGSKPVGTLVVRGQPPLQIASRELVLYPKDDAELARFLLRTGGNVLGEQRIDSAARGSDASRALLIAVDPARASAGGLGTLRALAGDDTELVASNADVLGLLTLLLEAHADGFVASLNPRLQSQGAPVLSFPEELNLSPNMSMVPARGVTGACVPHDPEARCVLDVPALWAFTALWDGDERPVNAAVLDFGFAPNEDFRTPADGTPLHQCNMQDALPLPLIARGGFPCGPGLAEGSPSIRSKGWHGTGVVSTLAGIANNAQLAAGVAGLSAVPMLYRNDVLSFAFELGAGVRQAVMDGASLINISAGYPCTAMTALGPIEYCSEEGRTAICGVATAGLAAAAATTCATLGWIPFVGGAICATAIAGATQASLACVASIGYGDLHGPLTSAVRFATESGVPIVASAGNVMSSADLPPVVRDLVDLSDQRLETWGVIPAAIPGVIAVGAVNGDPRSRLFLDNEQFYGSRVDVWAPTGTRYFAPYDVNDPASVILPQQPFGGTSAAAPYVAGVIASMQSVNPELDPATTTLTPEQRRQIVPIIRQLLTDSGMHNDELADLGYTDQPERRRLLVQPRAAVEAAVALRFPYLEEYDRSVNFSELAGNDDAPADANRLAVPGSGSGTIVHLPASGGALAAAPDVDWFVFTMPGDADTMQITSLDLTFPSVSGLLELQGAGIGLVSVSGGVLPQSTTRNYRVLARAGADVRFHVEGPRGNDNVYRVDIGAPTQALPELQILGPSEGSEVCAGELVVLEAGTAFGLFPGAAADDAAVEWFDGGSRIGTGHMLSHAFTLGEHTITARPYGADDAAESVTIEAIDCDGEPPVIESFSPSEMLILPDVTGYDGRYYLDLPVSAIVNDPEDGPLDGDAVIWSTERTDVQPEVVGTGARTTLRLYATDSCGLDHVIRVHAVDSQNNRSASRSVRIIATVLC
jgi:subtilisin family serine protease